MSETSKLQRVAVFCGSSPGADPIYREAAVELGELLVRRGLGLVYGGGNVGLMGTVADTVMEGGGEVVGVIPRMLVEREVAHHGITDLRVVGSMHERKRLMYQLSGAMLALPGGMGTFEELFEALTWNQLGLHQKRCGLLNVAGYYDPLAEMVDKAVEEGFVRTPHREYLCVETDPGRLLDRLAEPPPAMSAKWTEGPSEASSPSG